MGQKNFVLGKKYGINRLFTPPVYLLQLDSFRMIVERKVELPKLRMVISVAFSVVFFISRPIFHELDNNGHYKKNHIKRLL